MRSKTGPQPWKAMGRWMQDDLSSLQKAIVFRSLADIEIAEHPLGSNRSASIDEYLRRAGVDETVIESGQGYWCAAACGAWTEDAGGDLPLGYALCQNWLTWAQAKGLWIAGPSVARLAQSTYLEGYAALFGSNGEASHIGIITRYDDGLARYISGNTSSNGLSSTGTMVAIHDLPAPPRFLGLVRPTPAPA